MNRLVITLSVVVLGLLGLAPASAHAQYYSTGADVRFGVNVDNRGFSLGYSTGGYGCHRPRPVIINPCPTPVYHYTSPVYYTPRPVYYTPVPATPVYVYPAQYAPRRVIVAPVRVYGPSYSHQPYRSYRHCR